MRVLEEKELQDRRNRLLQTVILEFIRTARPVSSASIAELDGMNLSSATVRNLLHQLEEEGFLEHPHTSAGRVPTDKGYRYYVDYLINLREHLLNEEEIIRSEYLRRRQQIEDVLQQTSRLLAYLSHQAGFVLSPKMDESRLQRIELIPIGEGRVLMVIVASNGLVRYKIMEGFTSAATGQIRGLTRWINCHFKGKNLREFCLQFSHELEAKILEEKNAMREIADFLAEPIESLGKELEDPGLLVEGTSNLLKSPDMAMETKYLQDVASTFENREKLTQLIRKEVQRKQQGKRGETSVVIGRESRHPVFQNLALLAKAFETQDHTIGFLGIIGPKRMEYGRMMSLVESVQAAVQKLLNKSSRETTEGAELERGK